MELLGGILSVKAVVFLMFSVFAIAAIGYAIGKITIKGINLGTAGVFIIALVYGCILYTRLSDNLMAGDISFASDALKVVENMGLIFFVTSVGFIAGPNFFGNLKRNFKSYVLLGVVIILAAAVTCVVCVMVGSNFTDLDHEQFRAIMVGLLSGALTSTPAFSASKAAVGADLEALVSVGYGISYLFGVVGVVLFVQIVPNLRVLPALQAGCPRIHPASALWRETIDKGPGIGYNFLISVSPVLRREGPRPYACPGQRAEMHQKG